MNEYPVTKDGRSTFKQTREGLEITTPYPRPWPVIIFLCIWLAFWAMAEITAIQGVFKGIKASERGEDIETTTIVFLTIWLTAWTLAGIFFTGLLLFMLFGKEIVTITNRAIVISVKAGKIGRTLTYDINEVLQLRIDINPSGGKIGKKQNDSRKHSLSVPKAMAFDYKDKKVEFGAGIRYDEANALMQLLKKCRSLKDTNFEMEKATSDGYREDSQGNVYIKE